MTEQTLNTQRGFTGTPAEPEKFNTLMAMYKQLESLDSLKAYLEATDAEDWQLDVCRSQDDKKNCLLGHIFNWGIAQREALGNPDCDDDKLGSAAVDAFEECWTTSFFYYRVNDGENPDYPQPTARERVLAMIDDLAQGKLLTTHEDMEWYAVAMDIDSVLGTDQQDAVIVSGLAAVIQNWTEASVKRSPELVAELVTASMARSWPDLADAWGERVLETCYRAANQQS